MLRLLLELAVLLACATGAGLAVRRVLGGSRLAPRPFAENAIVGACALAALLPALFASGLPRALVLAAAWLVAACGAFVARRGLARSARGDALLGVLFLGLLLGPLRVAATEPLLSTDALMIWWPKVQEVAAGAATDHRLTLAHLNPGYPRGSAWLTSVAAPWGPDRATMQGVAWLWTWLTALAMVGWSRRLGRPAIGLTLALAFVLLPDVAARAGQGMNDGAIGAAILVAAIGLGTRFDTTDGRAVAIAAGVGAAAIKEEGKLVALAVVAFLLADAWRRRLPLRALLPLLAPGLLLLPHALGAGRERATRLDVLPALLHAPDMLVARLIAVAEHMLRGFVAGSGFAGIVVAACLVLLVPRGPRPLPATPALLFLPAVALVYTGTGVAVAWHVGTTLDRLMIQLLPTLACASFLRVDADARAAPR